MSLRWDCDSRGCYKTKVLPDWRLLSGCFGNTRVRPMDVDGIVEQNGHCLFLEQKGPGGSLSEPQVRMFRLLATQGHTCIAFWVDHDGDVQSLSIFSDLFPRGKRSAAIGDLRDVVATWWAAVTS